LPTAAKSWNKEETTSPLDYSFESSTHQQHHDSSLHNTSKSSAIHQQHQQRTDSPLNLSGERLGTPVMMNGKIRSTTESPRHQEYSSSRMHMDSTTSYQSASPLPNYSPPRSPTSKPIPPPLASSSLITESLLNRSGSPSSFRNVGLNKEYSNYSSSLRRSSQDAATESRYAATSAAYSNSSVMESSNVPNKTITNSSDEADVGLQRRLGQVDLNTSENKSATDAGEEMKLVPVNKQCGFVITAEDAQTSDIHVKVTGM
jgi:hypothetical protein